MAAPHATGYALADLARHIGARLEGDGGIVVRRVTTLERGGDDAIAFLANSRYRAQLASTTAGAVIIAPADAGQTARPTLVADRPYLAYARAATLLHPASRPVAGVHPTAVIAPGAIVSPDSAVGPHVTIGPGAIVEDGVAIGPGCVIGSGVTIGADSTLYPNVVIYAECVIGPRATVHAGAVIGADGFGMAEDGSDWLRIPQVGRVVIGADCEIGANTTIDRGAIEDTLIGDDVKLDNQIQVAHNCSIGRHTAIAGCVGIAGSTRIGANCKIGGAAMISGHLSIPDGTVVSAGTFVPSTLPHAGVWTGVFPTIPHRDWQRAAARLRHIDALADRIRALERSHGKDGE